MSRCEGCDEETEDLHEVPCYEYGVPTGEFVWICDNCFDDLADQAAVEEDLEPG